MYVGDYRFELNLKNNHYDSLFKVLILLLFKYGEANRLGDCHWKNCLLFTAFKRGEAGPSLPQGRERAQGSTRVWRSQREKEKNMGKVLIVVSVGKNGRGKVSNLAVLVWTAVTQHHKLGGLHNKHFFLTALEARRQGSGCQPPEF